MLYIKDGFPEINEIVYCSVKKIYGNTTFVFLEEYEKEGVLTISEIAPGRIRNLRDHVIENKVIVCKVLRVDPKSNRIDVSLRRVPIPVMKDKLEKVKKEEYAEKIYFDVAKELKITKEELFEKTYEPIFENYEVVFEALYDIMLDNEKISMFTELNDNERQIFVKIINDRIKPEEVTFKKQFALRSTDENGIDEIKDTIKKALDTISHPKANVIYLAAGKYEIRIKHDDMKSADKLYKQFKEVLEKESKKSSLEFEISEKSFKDR